MNPIRQLPLVVAISAALTCSVHAQSLVDLYASARTYDATFQSAKSQFDATLARAEQSRALVLPTANLGIIGSRVNEQHDPTSLPGYERTFSNDSISITASQPLYRPANWAGYQQGQRQLDLAQVQLTLANQDLIVRVSQAYFDVLAAQDGLTFIKTQKAAVAEQLASAKRNFEVGTATITDTREAQARYDLVMAQEIAAENELRVKTLALDQLVGKSNTRPTPLAQPLALPALVPNDVTAWVQQGQAASPGIMQAQIALDVAQLETQKAQAGHKPTLDLTAQLINSNNLRGFGLGEEVQQAAIGVNFNLPLFAGFATQNRIKETLALQEKAASDLEGTRRNVEQATRAAYLGIVSGLGQVNALEAAEVSSQSAVDANKLGYQVGVRINIDVLNAQSQLYDTKAKLAKARYDVLVAGLKLRQANGTLTADDLNAINALLVK